MSKQKILNYLPKHIIVALKEFLNTDNEYKVLKKQLSVTGIIIENDEYQIAIPTIEKLNEIKELLNKKY